MPVDGLGPFLDLRVWSQDLQVNSAWLQVWLLRQYVIYDGVTDHNSYEYYPPKNSLLVKLLYLPTTFQQPA